MYKEKLLQESRKSVKTSQLNSNGITQERKKKGGEYTTAIPANMSSYPKF